MYALRIVSRDKTLHFKNNFLFVFCFVFKFADSVFVLINSISLNLLCVWILSNELLKNESNPLLRFISQRLDTYCI